MYGVTIKQDWRNLVQRIVNEGDKSLKRLKLCAVNIPQGNKAVQEIDAEFETSTRAVVDSQIDRSVV